MSHRVVKHWPPGQGQCCAGLVCVNEGTEPSVCDTLHTTLPGGSARHHPMPMTWPHVPPQPYEL